MDFDGDDESFPSEPESTDDEERCVYDDVFTTFLSREKYYTVLTENDIRQRQDDDVTQISSVSSISSSEAITLLCHYKWNVSKLLDSWFADEETVRSRVGFLGGPTTRNFSLTICGICFEDYPPEEILSTNYCAHTYCSFCWRSYVMNTINDSGQGCLSLRCPDPSCPASVGLDFTKKVGLAGADEAKYEHHLMRSYVEGKKEKIKWCPAPGCDNAVEFELGSGDGYDVMCLCSNAFCWNCTEDAHRPADCKIVAQWITKNSSESENTNWILAYSKPCPKCKRSIEKSVGCNHMTCSQPCRFEFCWLCLTDWHNHRISCNRFQRGGDEEGEELKIEEERQREMAKQSVQRYTHYYERWASNHRSMQKAIEDWQKMKTIQLKGLSERLKESEKQLSFILDAWKQIIECRRVLKWSYAYGYYLPEEEHAKRQLFEYSQGEAETGLERLHQCAERELWDSFINVVEDDHKPKADFDEFRTKLRGLTKVTCSYFENLVGDLENGLSDVESSQ